jgi:hypothetical protein
MDPVKVNVDVKDILRILKMRDRWMIVFVLIVTVITAVLSLVFKQRIDAFFIKHSTVFDAIFITNVIGLSSILSVYACWFMLKSRHWTVLFSGILWNEDLDPFCSECGLPLSPGSQVSHWVCKKDNKDFFTIDEEGRHMNLIETKKKVIQIRTNKKDLSNR